MLLSFVVGMYSIQGIKILNFSQVRCWYDTSGSSITVVLKLLFVGNRWWQVMSHMLFVTFVCYLFCQFVLKHVCLAPERNK
jgi:hypothetical protein